MHKILRTQTGRLRGCGPWRLLSGLVVALWLSASGPAAADAEKTPSSGPVVDVPSGTPAPDGGATGEPVAEPSKTADSVSQKDAPKETSVKSAPQKKKKKGKARKRRKTRKRKARRRKKSRCQTYTPPRYKKMRRRWLKQPKIAKPRYREGFRDMSFYAINLGERLRIKPYLPNGEIDPEALQALEALFRDKDDNSTHPIHPRLIKLLYKILDHFKARQITIISGYRSDPGHVSESNHGKGRAIDFVIPGVPVAVLARYARRLGKVGVGHYPNAGFVHLDVRDRWSYFWVDRSGPGKPQCPKRVLAKAGQKSDARWRSKHDRPRRRKDRKGRPLGSVEKIGAVAP